MQRLGERNPNHKLTVADVRLLRVLLDARLFTRTSLAREFGVTRQAVHYVESGRNWGTA